MSSKENNSKLNTKLDYEKILEEEVINSYENKYGAEVDLKNKRFYRLRCNF